MALSDYQPTNGYIAKINKVKKTIDATVEGGAYRYYYDLVDGMKAGLDTTLNLSATSTDGYINLGNNISQNQPYLDAVDVVNGSLYTEPTIGLVYKYTGATVSGISSGDRLDLHPARLDADGELVNASVWVVEKPMYQYKNRGLYSGYEIAVTEKVDDINANLSGTMYLNIQYDVPSNKGIALTGIDCDVIKVYIEEYRVGMWHQLESYAISARDISTFELLCSGGSYSRRGYVRLLSNQSVSGSVTAEELETKTPTLTEACMFDLSEVIYLSDKLIEVGTTVDRDSKTIEMDSQRNQITYASTYHIDATSSGVGSIGLLKGLTNSECLISTEHWCYIGRYVVKNYTSEAVNIGIDTVEYSPEPYTRDSTDGYPV